MLLCTLACVVAGSAHPGMASAAPGANGGRACGPSWAIVSSPSPGNAANVIQSVSALSATDAWGAGVYNTLSSDALTLTTTPLFLRWNGATWTQFPSNSSSGNHFIQDVVEISSSDAWAIGPFGPYGEHWNGSSWSEVTMPTEGSSASLLGVTAASSADVWAVGSYFDDGLGRNQSLVEHWDGTTWSIVPSPNFGTDDNGLGDVTAITANDVWATGSISNEGAQTAKPYFLHWDGSAWSMVRAWKPPGVTNTGLGGIDANSSGAVFTPGVETLPQNGIFAEHRIGTRWRPMSVVSPKPINYLTGVGVDGTGEAWVVGRTSQNGSVYKTLIEHSSSNSFVLDTSANVTGATNELFGADVSPDGDVWAVGESTVSGSASQTLIEHLCP